SASRFCLGAFFLWPSSASSLGDPQGHGRGLLRPSSSGLFRGSEHGSQAVLSDPCGLRLTLRDWFLAAKAMMRPVQAALPPLKVKRAWSRADRLCIMDSDCCLEAPCPTNPSSLLWPLARAFLASASASAAAPIMRRWGAASSF